jgi:hypothetical protein
MTIQQHGGIARKSSFSRPDSRRRRGDTRRLRHPLEVQTDPGIEPRERLKTCECDKCQLRPRNVAIHNLLHPLNQLQTGEEAKYYSRNLLGRLRGKRVIA